MSQEGLSAESLSLGSQMWAEARALVACRGCQHVGLFDSFDKIYQLVSVGHLLSS